MSRRSFLRLCALGVAASPESLVSHAAEPTQKIARVGVVYPESPASAPRGVSAFWRRLSELGWVEGRNLVIEARWAEGRIDRLPALMHEVIGRGVSCPIRIGLQAALVNEAIVKRGLARR